MRENELHCLEKIKRGLNGLEQLQVLANNANLSIIRRMLNSAHQTEEDSKFPDFFFDGGIIEHFEVTASKDNCKGSRFRKEFAKFKDEDGAFFQQADEDFLKGKTQPEPFKVKIRTHEYNNFSYEWFINSFIKHFDDHLDSLNRSDYRSGVKVFLIEQVAGRMSVFENNRFSRLYTISEDRRLLSYVAEHRKEIDYVLFIASGILEIVDVSNVDRLLKSAKNNLDIRNGRYIEQNLKVYLGLSFDESKKFHQ